MSISPSSVSRTTPPAERSNQRAERAPAGDFAALLDIAPSPARAPLARAAERHDSPASAAGQDERRERPESASARSRHARPGGGPPSAAPGRETAAPEPSHGRASKADDAFPAPASPVDASVAPAATVPTEGAPTPPADTTSAPPAGLEVAALSAELPVLPVAAEPPAAHVAAAVASAAAPVAGGAGTPAPQAPPLAFAPAGLPLGTVGGDAVPVAADVAPIDAAAVATAAPSPAPAADAAVASATVPTAIETATAAATDTQAAATTNTTGDPAAAAGLPVAEDAVSGRPDAEVHFTADGEPLATVLANGAGAGTGTGAGSAGGRDGETAGTAVTEEVVDAPAGVPAPASAPAPAAAQGAGRGPDAVPFGPHRSVPLERASRAVAQLLHVASESGVSHARIALRPVELGGIEIFLQVSPAGLSAQVIADSPEAARMLAQATEDLRRSLAGQDVALVSIDVSTSAEQQQREHLASGAFVTDDFTSDGRPARRADAGGAATPAPTELTTPTVLELPDGLLVDVLA